MLIFEDVTRVVYYYQKFGHEVDPAEFAKNVRGIPSVPADAIPPESEMPKNPKGRPRKGADYGQQAIG